MANVKDCPGFETFGEDVRAGRKAQGIVSADDKMKENAEEKM